MKLDKDIYAKKKSVLSNQAVKKKKHANHGHMIWGAMRFVMSFFLKAAVVVVVMASVSAALVYLYKFVTESPYIALTDVQITGVDESTRHELIRLAGLNEMPCLLTLSPEDVKAKMERHPWIRSVELEKQFPHTLIVRAERQSPMALVQLDKLYYMNKWGKVFKEVVEGDDTDYPVVTGISLDQENAGEKLALAAGILESFASETGYWSLDDISEVHVNNSGDALVYSVSLPFAIRVGGENLAEDKRKVKELVAYLQSTSGFDAVGVIDMNYHDGAVVSYKKVETDLSEKKKDQAV